ncbi:MAG: hypothetical protein AB7K68_16085 [Bacteriovoracia bacterium]
MKFIIAALVLTSIFAAEAMAIENKYPMSVVRHRWQEKITESNHAALRPGSIYDINTYFEENFGFSRPQFNYFFYDTGLGAADPIYPVYQSGYQRSWAQLIKSGVSGENRHIDHASIGATPEGCEVKSTYWVRHINEFPDMYAEERAAGYTLVDISFDYYVKTRPDAQCGKHFAHEASDFDAFKEIDPYADSFRTFADIPPALLEKYEAKVGILKLVTEEFSRTKWPRYGDVYSLRENSMWFYPDGFLPDYGISEPRPQPGLEFLNKPRQLVFDATPATAKEFPLTNLMGSEGWEKFLGFLNGKPTPDFNEASEPGNDTLKLSDVTTKNLYTSGLDIFPITNVAADVSDPARYKLVSILSRPYEPETDIHFSGEEKTPQVRFIFQLMDPAGKHAYEQLYIHLMFDAVDRLAKPEQRQEQLRYFLTRLDKLTEVREKESAANAEAATIAFVREFTQRPVQTIAFSSSLTGIWVFGTLTRSYNEARRLEPMRVVRAGIDLGFYSTAYDTVLFREEIKRSKGKRKAELEQILKDLTPEFYRDPRRHDANTLTFHRVSCAQCHQMAGRDGVHITLNDNLDRRITTPYRATEFMFRELDRQLKGLSPAIGSPASLK